MHSRLKPSIILGVILAAFSAFTPGGAAAATVSPGCDAPPSSYVGRKFYIDPVRGSMENDGSAERPWSTLAEVLNPTRRLIATRAYPKYPPGAETLQPINPQAPVKPGDTLVLLSGDHGDVNLQQMMNSGFIAVVGPANNTAVIRTLKITASSHWHFKNLKFEGLRKETTWPMSGLVELKTNDYFGATDSFVFESNVFTSQDDVSAWSNADWVKKPYDYAFVMSDRVQCTTIQNNHFYNIRNAIAVGGDNTVIEDNLIEHFGNDGIDIAASNLIIRHNTIRDGHHTPEESMHADGIQGWTLHGATNKNVTIDGNTIINLEMNENNYLQGISIFDGLWNGLRVTNNVVVTNTWHGIALYGVENAEVVNNTVPPARPGKFMTWIAVRAAKTKQPSSNVVIRNNIAGQIVLNGVDVRADHNITTKGVFGPKPQSDTVPSERVVIGENLTGIPMESLFSAFDLRAGIVDLHLSSTSAARKAGSSDSAPVFDRDGRRRVEPIDIGAYAR